MFTFIVAQITKNVNSSALTLQFLQTKKDKKMTSFKKD